MYRPTKGQPWTSKTNPAPLLKNGEKVSLDLLCNFDQERFLRDNPGVNEWLEGTDHSLCWRVTSLLLDFLVVFVASNLARYYIPAWQAIVEANSTQLFNDVRAAYDEMESGIPYFFEDEHPFQYSFGTRSPIC